MKLQETKHSYYCAQGDNVTHCLCWDDFVKYELGYDRDLNLLFRFDLIHQPYEPASGTYPEVEEEFYLELHHALQRHGYGQWTVVIHHIEQEDMPSIESYLQVAKDHMLDMWREVE